MLVTLSATDAAVGVAFPAAGDGFALSPTTFPFPAKTPAGELPVLSPACFLMVLASALEKNRLHVSRLRTLSTLVSESRVSPGISSSDYINLGAALDEHEGRHCSNGVLPGYVLTRIASDQSRCEDLVDIPRMRMILCNSHITLQELHASIFLRQRFILWRNGMAWSTPIH